MEIIIKFTSLQEYENFIDQAAKSAPHVEVSQEETARMIKAMEKEAVQALPKEKAPAPEPAPMPEPVPAPAPAAPEAPAADPEELRVQARKILADLNKKTGKNIAKDIIAEAGYKRLTDVPAELLLGILDKAQEAANA